MKTGRRIALVAVLGLLGGMLSASSAGATTFTNASPITIPTQGDASPYPSAITVAGIPGPITDVNVTLNAFSHTDPDDIGFVLVGPGGQALLLDDGGGDATDAVALNITLDDSAPTALPGNTALTSGSFRPAAYFAGDNFGPPGPGTSYGNPGPIGGGTATLASTFNGATANGVWNLFIHDFGPLEGGQIASGWSLEISPDPPTVMMPVMTTPFATQPTSGKKCRKAKKRSAAAAKKKKCKKKGKKKA